MSRSWSKQQLAIIDRFEHPAKPVNDHLVIEAVAGSGKTTVVLEGVNHAPEQSILLCAFNKIIADELTNRVSNTNAQAKTLHGLGFACVARYWEKVRLCQKNARAIGLTERVCGGAAPDPIKRLVTDLHCKAREIAPHASTPSTYDERGVMINKGDLVDLAFAFDCVPDPEWTAEGWTLQYVEKKALAAMELAATERPRDGIDFSDMIFLPVRNRWYRPLADLVVVDECQDMTAAQLELAQGSCTPTGRMVLVGDRFQSLYGFRGADTTGMERLKQELNADTLPLNTTFRCGKKIVTLAQRLVPHFSAFEKNSDGSVEAISFNTLVDAAQPSDFILSRKNAPLVSVAMALIRAQKRVRMRGRDIGKGLKAILLKLTKAKRINSVPAFLEKLASWEEKECDRATRADQEGTVERIHDQADTLRTLSEGAVGLRDIEARIDTLFTDDGQGAAGVVTCSSVHKAKGLEADRVFILRDTLYPGRKKQTPAQAQEEANIEYVAITRAMSTLVWVEGLPGQEAKKTTVAQAAATAEEAR